MSKNVFRAWRSSSFFFKPFFIKVYCNQGTTSTATKSEAANTTVMPSGNHFTKSFIIPFIVRRSGKKVMEMANVALKIELKNSFAE